MRWSPDSTQYQNTQDVPPQKKRFHVFDPRNKTITQFNKIRPVKHHRVPFGNYKQEKYKNTDIYKQRKPQEIEVTCHRPEPCLTDRRKPYTHTHKSTHTRAHTHISSIMRIVYELFKVATTIMYVGTTHSNQKRWLKHIGTLRNRICRDYRQTFIFTSNRSHANAEEKERYTNP